MDADEKPDVDALVVQLKARVERRRREGAYPPELEAEMDAHFQRIASHRPTPYDYEALRVRLGELDHAMGFSPAHIEYGSGLPGGTALHRTVGKAVSRQTAGILEQMHGFAEAIRNVLREMVVVLEHPNAHVHAELLGQVDALMERFADLDRTPQDPLVGLSEVRSRLERLEAAEAARRFTPWFGAATFEDQFRGSKGELRDRYVDLASRLAGCGPVVDLGCGRGEFLQLLAEQGVEARGIEIDRSLVEAGRTIGLPIEYGDAVEWLAAEPDGSLGGIAMIQVIEHLTPKGRTEVVRLAAEKLRPGGRILVETLNPQSLYIFARAFYADPTHDTPVHPAYLEFLLKEAGFRDIGIEWRSPPPEGEPLEPVTGTADDPDQIVAQVNANIARVNAILFGPQDYAILAVR
ncbi:MAG TPA: class I SAM-dependent methyltransferase [Acidimicrobiales bacterium]|nr:class I SAM-dependent methyltransferase [Acidimicrobiales bacterium]